MVLIWDLAFIKDEIFRLGMDEYVACVESYRCSAHSRPKEMVAPTHW